MSRDHPSLEEYEARAAAALDDRVRQGTPQRRAQAEYEADLEAETYADRWQAWMESQEPEPEPELEAET